MVCRVCSRKSEVRSFTRTPRAASPSSRILPATVSAARWSHGRIAASPTMSVSRVFSEPMDFTSRSGTTALASRPCASACTWAPRVPSQRSSASRGVAATSPIVARPRASRRSRVRGPTPQSRSIGNGCRKRVTSSGGTTVSPSGLPRSLATFATYLVVETPHRDGESGRLEHRAPDRFAHRPRLAGERLASRHVDERLVDAQGFDEGREGAEGAHHDTRDGAVPLETGREHDRVRAAAARRRHRHRAPHSVRPRLVARGGDHAARSGAADEQRLAAKLRVVELFDGREERVHVGVEDDARPAGSHDRMVVPVATGAARRSVRPECSGVLGGASRLAALRPPARAGSRPLPEGRDARSRCVRLLLSAPAGGTVPASRSVAGWEAERNRRIDP